MEDVCDDGEVNIKRNLVLIPNEDKPNQIVERLSNAVDAGKIDNYVWATPGLPMLIFITVGLIAALVFGDVVWLLVRFIIALKKLSFFCTVFLLRFEYEMMLLPLELNRSPQSARIAPVRINSPA